MNPSSRTNRLLLSGLLFIQSFLAINLLSACSREEDGKAVSWIDLRLEGKKLNLINDTKLETFSFGSSSTVSTELGMKNGPMTGPLYYWRIEQDKLVISEGPGADAEFRLYEPKINKNIITVRRNFFQTARYLLGPI